MESLDLKIRPAIKNDCLSIYKLIKELGEHCGESDSVSIKAEGLERNGFYDDPPFFMGIVAEVTEKDATSPRVIGSALYHLKYSTWEGPVMHLNTFVVSSKYRRQGAGTKLLQSLAATAETKKYTRISFEVSKNNEAGVNFFSKHGAINLTKDEGWLNYDMSPDTVKKIIEVSNSKEVDNVEVRPTEPKDCAQIKEMIQELAEFEKMPEGPKLGVKDLQRDGFYKLFPDYYSFVAEYTDAESEDKEIIGYNLFFLTYDPFKGKKIHLEDIYVTPKHRGKGVGEILFNSVAKYSKEGRYSGFTLEVLDWNSKAIQFYDKFGGTNMTTSSRALESFRFRAKEIKDISSNN